MKKKLLAVLLATSMAVSLAACGSGGSSSNSGNGDAAGTTEGAGEEKDNDAGDTDGGAGEAAAGDIDLSEHVTITYMTTGDSPTGTKEVYENALAKLNEILTEKVNASLDIYFINWTDYLSNYNLTLAQMDGTVDLVGTASDWLDAWPNAKNGAFLELSEEMLQTYAPQTWASVPEDHWDLCKYDGSIYLMPEDNYAQWTNHGFVYRLDYAIEAGLEDGVNSWEDMTEYFRYVKEAYPDIIPWNSDGTHHTQLAGGWLASHSDFVAVDGISSGAIWGGTKDDLYTIVTPFYTDRDMMIEFAETMKEWDNIGVWKTDVLNNTASDNREEYRIGEVAAEQHHTQTWTDLVSKTSQNVFYEENPDAASGFFYFGKESGNVVELSITHGAMAVSAASENPERALMVYDLLRNDPECYKLFVYGEEGVSYEINEEGYRVEPEGYNADADNVNGTTNYWWGRNDDIEVRDAGRDWEAIDALYDEYDSLKIAYPYGQFVPEVDDIQAKIQNVNEVHINYMKQIAFGKYSGTAEEIVDEYQAALGDAGIEDVTAALQDQFDALYK